MQDKITLAIDALASAAFIEGGVSPENTLAARDLTEQRKRELLASIGAPCLHQIQEPAPSHQPVSGQSRFTGQKWEPCAAEHVAMVLATPHEWQGYEVRYLYAAPAEGSVSNATFQAAPAAVAEQALLKVLRAIQRYLPPDGVSGQDTLTEIIGIVDPWPLGAVPAAVAVPEGRDSVLRDLTEHASQVDDHTPQSFASGVKKLAARARAVLAATPAAPAAAAPVVLPEPFALYDGEKWYANEEAAICSCANMQKLQKVYTEQQLRALLATATGLPAQATWLQPKGLESLQRFEETASDNQGHDIGKAAVARLAGFGCLQSHGFGVYSITDFGHFVMDDWEHARALPFRTQAERDADQRATIAAAKGE
ncbi:hypothetical protein COAQ111491_22050 [Comamonas aquatilis]|uniref:hypothetical protein n=1 Tax=Comamonas aquatilis TaxID=1778406 RepID=UPI0039EEBD8D